MDGGFFTKAVYGRYKRHATAQDVQNYLTETATLYRSRFGDLLRLYFYDAPPALKTYKNPISKAREKMDTTPLAVRATKLHSELKASAQIAVRMGEIEFRGWRVPEKVLVVRSKEGKPIAAEDLLIKFEQKGVDLRLGLDLAYLAIKGIVDTVVLVSGDSDLIPAMKLARREGVVVYVDHIGLNVKTDYIAHSDGQLNLLPAEDSAASSR